jgi:hypothetical protein
VCTAAAFGRPFSFQFTDSNSICMEQPLMAEREFSAFISAVKELLGPDQAQLSAVGLTRRVGING